MGDKYAKRFALDFDLDYHEFPPFTNHIICIVF